MVTSCIFCGDLELTPEHVFSKWISKAHPKETFTGEGHHAYGIVLSNPEADDLDNLWEKRRELYNSGDCRVSRLAARAASAVVVCRKCNNGWMSLCEQKLRTFMKPYIEVDKPSNPMYLRLASSQWDTCAHWVAMKAAVIAADAGYLLPAGDLFNIKDGRIPPDARIEYMPSSVAADAYGVVVHGIRSKETGDLRCAVVAIRFTGQMFRYAWAGIPGKRLKSGGAFLTWSVQPRTKVPIMQGAEDLVKRGFRRFESYMKELDEFASDVDLEDVPPGEGTNVDGVG